MRLLPAFLNATGPRPSPTEKCLYRFVPAKGKRRLAACKRSARCKFRFAPAKGKRRLAACKRSARFVYLHCQPLLPYGPSAKRRDAASPFLVAPSKGKRRLAACKRSARSVPVTVSRCHDKEQLQPLPYNERARAFARALRCLAFGLMAYSATGQRFFQ